MAGFTRRYYPTKQQRVEMAPYRSMFEKHLATNLAQRGIGFNYETETLPYTVPEQSRRYTPDFIITTRSGLKVYIEAKGLFTPDDRKKAILVRNDHPDVDIRFVFMNSANKLSARSKTTYAMWCEKHGFMWADKFVPDAWLTE